MRTYRMIIYKTINLMNGKIYIGKDSLNDSNYLGSGRVITYAIRKYGRENFVKEVIDVAETKRELSEKEKYWVKIYGSKTPNGYNLTSGGDGGDTFSLMNDCDKEKRRKSISLKTLGKRRSEETRRKISLAKIGSSLSEETKKKISFLLMGREFKTETRNKLSIASKGNKHWFGKHHNDETKKKMSLLHKGNKSMTGRCHSNETKKKMSMSALRREEKKRNEKDFSLR